MHIKVLSRARGRRQYLFIALGIACLVVLVFCGSQGVTSLAQPERTLLRGAPRAQSAVTNATALRAMGLDHLIMVAGHAVTIKGDLTAVDRDERTWYLLPYQTGQDLPAEFVRHIREGVSLAAADPRSLLVFSGGQTRGDAGPRSEGASYWLVAERFAWWGHVATVGARAAAEEHARDSLENLLFALCRFRELTGTYPRRVTVVSFWFKRRRFEQV